MTVSIEEDEQLMTSLSSVVAAGDAPDPGQHSVAVATDRFDIESLARGLHTLRRPLSAFRRWRGRAEEAKEKYVERAAAGYKTLPWVTPPAGILYGLGIFGAILLAPEIGVDLTGTSAALIPSKEEFGSDAAVYLASASLGGVLAGGALATGMLAASVVHMGRNRLGRLIGAAGVLLLCVAFNQAIYEVGKDRSHGLKSAQITQQADDTYQQVDDIDSAIKELQVRALHGKGNRPLARPAGMTTLERRRDQLERHAQALEQKATETKTTGSLTWVQLAGFLMAAIGGALFELGTMVRLRGRIVRLRDRADEAYGTLFLTAQALWAVPRRKGGAGPDVLAKARDHLDGIAPKPEWEALDALVAQARSGVADERDDSLLKAVR